jgi:hypothetical protein
MEETIKKYKQQISHKVDEILSFQSIFVDFFTVELALPFVGINVLGV